MEPALHVVLLVTLPVLAGWAMRRSYAAPTPGRAAAAIAFGGACALAGFAQMNRGAGGAVPLAQWILPGGAASAVMLFVGARGLRRTLAFASVATAFVLSSSFTSLVARGAYASSARAEGARVEWHTVLTGLYARAR